MVAIEYGANEQDYDFWAYNAAGQLWDNVEVGFVDYSVENFINYRIAATETTPGRYEADVPTGTVRFELRKRGASASESRVIGFDKIEDDSAVEELRKLARADVVTDTSGTPYKMVWKDEDTGDILMSKDIKKVNGGDLISEQDIVGGLEKT